MEPIDKAIASYEAEEAVLGAILGDPASIARVLNLKPEHFYLSAHQQIFKAMLMAFDSGRLPDLTYVALTLQDMGATISRSFLADLTDRVISSVNIDGHAAFLHEKWRVRQFLEQLETIKNTLHSEKRVGKCLDTLNNAVAELGTDAESNTRSTHEITPQVVQQILYGAPVVAPTKLRDLDGILGGGFSPGELVIVAARPSMGKTAFSLTIAMNMAKLYPDDPVLFFSLEMGADSLIKRLVSQQSEIEYSRLNAQSGLSKKEVDQVMWAQSTIPPNLLINDDSAIDLAGIRGEAMKTRPRAIFIDYLQLIETSGRDRHTDLGKITRGLKALGRQLDCPVIALSQLNRSVEARTNKRPMQADIKESGNIEQDADVILMLYRDEYYHPDTTDRGIAEVIIAKQRNGPTGTVKLLFDPRYTLFKSLGYHG